MDAEDVKAPAALSPAVELDVFPEARGAKVVVELSAALLDLLGAASIVVLLAVVRALLLGHGTVGALSVPQILLAVPHVGEVVGVDVQGQLSPLVAAVTLDPVVLLFPGESSAAETRRVVDESLGRGFLELCVCVYVCVCVGGG